MNRIKSINGYTIFQAGPRDVKKHGFTEGSFYVYFSSDVRDFGIANSSPEFKDCGSLEEAAANCVGNFAIAKEIVESRTTAASMAEILEVEAQLDAGVEPDTLYEEGLGVVDDDTIQRVRATAVAADLPFSDRPSDSTTEPAPYVYDGSMTVADFELVQKAQAAHEEIASVVAAHSPHIDPELLDRIADAAVGLHIAPETVKQVTAALLKALRPIVEWATSVARRFYEAIAAGIVPGKWLHLAKHAKKARVRKKYRSRIRQAVFATLASEGGGSS